MSLPDDRLPPLPEPNCSKGEPLAAQGQEPAAWTTPEELRNAQRGFGASLWAKPKIHPEGEVPLYTSPPPATDQDALDARRWRWVKEHAYTDVCRAAVDAAIAATKERPDV